MFSLVADYSDTSSDSDADDEEQQTADSLNKKNETPLGANKNLLPSANLLLNTSSKKSTGVVFNNPFLEAEKAEIDKLQKHVKMVETEENLREKNGRKICWNNRKGRCRFGNKCKYAHDSDLIATVASTENPDENDRTEKESLSSTPPPNAVVVKTARLSNHSLQQQQQLSSDNTSSAMKSFTRKRPGLGDSIVPGKKVMNHYHQTSKLEGT